MSVAKEFIYVYLFFLMTSNQKKIPIYAYAGYHNLKKPKDQP